MAINGLPMPDAVTVLVSTELIAELTADWSPPVQIQVRRTPGIGSGYEMTARTHTCHPNKETLITALHQAPVFDQGDGTWDTPTMDEAERIVDVLLTAWTLPPKSERPLHVMSCDDCRADLDLRDHYPDCEFDKDGDQHCRTVEVDGDPIHVYGDGEMDHTDRMHFTEIVRAAKRKHEADQAEKGDNE